MEWVTPKTDWQASYDENGNYTGDYFNIEDYNRIIGNLTYLKALADTLFLPFTTADMGSEKTYSSMIYASEINVIENNLEAINQNTYGFNIGEKVSYQVNKGTPLWSELNRIESACLLLYKTMRAHKAALPRLAFTLGGQKGVRT